MVREFVRRQNQLPWVKVYPVAAGKAGGHEEQCLSKENNNKKVEAAEGCFWGVCQDQQEFLH